MLEHEHRREDLGGRVRHVLAGVLGRGAVHGLEDRALGADVGARRDAETADETGREVGDDVAVEVRQHEHVPPLGVQHELHARRVHDVVLELDAGVLVLLGDLAGDLQEQAVGHLEDVGLVHRGDLLAAVGDGVVEGVAHDALGAGDRDRLERDARVGADDAGAVVGGELDELGGVLASPARTRCRRRGPRCSRAR